MTNNYVKTRGGAFHFFNDRDTASTKEAVEFAFRNAGPLDRNQKPPAYGGITVFRSLPGHNTLLAVGEVRDQRARAAA